MIMIIVILAKKCSNLRGGIHIYIATQNVILTFSLNPPNHPPLKMSNVEHKIYQKYKLPSNQRYIKKISASISKEIKYKFTTKCNDSGSVICKTKNTAREIQ